VPTPLNQPIGPYRRVDWLLMDLHRLRAVARKLGGTVNDAVLSVVAGGVRRFLKNSRQEEVDDLEFRVMAPVSLREAGERGKLGNRVSAWFVPLPVGESDPLRRFERVHEATGELRRSKAALAGDTLTRVTEWTGPGLLTLGSRLASVGMPFHMVVTNVPGPREPLYVLGARLLEMHPMVPLIGNLATGIALLSYRDRLSWGFSADWDLVPDLHDFVRAVEHAFERLCDAAGVGA
jgi:WS/DGAT/MGAT family acyltransferase